MAIAIPSSDDIEKAHLRIKDFLHRTPVMSSTAINQIAGCSIFFKCENFQKAGVFKARGATNAVFGLAKHELINGVATHSSGNHAAALSMAASLREAHAYIVMPDNSNKAKINAVREYGGEIIFCKPTLQAREETLQQVIDDKHSIEIHPYSNFNVIAGQATAAKELIEDIVDLNCIISPVGGGGLLSGTALSASYFGQNISVIGAEPEGADDAFRSFHSNTLIPSVNPKTIADGLLTSLGEINYRIIKDYVYDIMTVSEEEIVNSMRMVWERMKIIIEPSSAVTLAVILKNKEYFEGKRIGIIISGGNVDLENLPFKKIQTS